MRLDTIFFGGPEMDRRPALLLVGPRDKQKTGSKAGRVNMDRSSGDNARPEQCKPKAKSVRHYRITLRGINRGRQSINHEQARRFVKEDWIEMGLSFVKISVYSVQLLGNEAWIPNENLMPINPSG